jgi:hypothetical protein
VDQSQLHSSLERSEFLIVRGAVETRLRDFDAARATFDDARIYSISAASASAEAEYHFYQGVWSFAALDFEQTDCEATAALTVEQAPFESAAYFVPLANTRARAMQLRGLVAAGRERYREQTDCLRSAIFEMRRAETSDLWIFASLLMNLAFQVRDFDLTDDAQMLRDEMAIAQWPSELASMEFEIFELSGGRVRFAGITSVRCAIFAGPLNARRRPRRRSWRAPIVRISGAKSAKRIASGKNLNTRRRSRNASIGTRSAVTAIASHSFYSQGSSHISTSCRRVRRTSVTEP